MKFLYPASHEIPHLSDSVLAVKVARHSQCSLCKSCTGLHPKPGVVVSLDDDDDGGGASTSLGGLTGYGSDEEEGPDRYLNSCACGHDLYDHGADKTAIGPDEFARRGRVSVRLDEMLEDAGKLLDFGYTDEDIVSLRKQMTLSGSLNGDSANGLVSTGYHSSPEKPASSPTSSVLSDLPGPPNKKRRISFSSSLSGDDDDDDEDRPLAARIASAGKKSMHPLESSNGTHKAARPRAGRGKKAKAHTAPVSLPPPTEEEEEEMKIPVTNGVNGHDAKVKVEEVMEEDQLNRLATGVTVDTASSAATAPPGKPEKIAQVELRRGVIQIIPVENDGAPRSWIILTGLKTLFQKQLPKMPREYIARLVYDSNSKALAIVKRGLKVVGGICYRPFPHRGFAEIVFFATASVDQVKGYGGMLMDHFKTHIKRTYPSMMHFLTYADNYAVGYFKKQGFSKEITLDRSVWAGYIKDYEGGTIMQCTMLRKVDYLHAKDTIAAQREVILTKIREMSKSHIVYAGLPQFVEAREGEEVRVDPRDVPGLRESGWTPEMATMGARLPSRNAEHAIMRRLLSEMQGHPSGWPFLQPVSKEEVADYYDVVKSPMDLSTMEHKLDTNQYRDLDSFIADAQLVFDNCRSYNPEATVYAKCARHMDKWLKQQMADRVKKES